MLIGVAGPAANFILAFVLMIVYFGWINEVPDIKTATLEWVTPGSAAADAGLQPGDVFRQFGNVKHPDFDTVLDLTRKQFRTDESGYRRAQRPDRAVHRCTCRTRLEKRI